MNALRDIANADSRVLKDPEAFIALSSLADSSVNLTCRVWVKGSDYWPVYFALNKQIYEEFNRQGIGFPFPQLQIHQ